MLFKTFVVACALIWACVAIIAFLPKRK